MDQPKPNRGRVAAMRATPLDERQRALAAEYLPLARSIARPFKEARPDLRDEFESAACYGLVMAARSFDAARGLRFATFARWRIRGELLEVGRGRPADGLGPMPVEVPFSTIQKAGFRVQVAAEADPVGAALEAEEGLEAWLGKLPPRHADACRMYYRDGLTMAEVGRRLGCSGSEACRLHRVALRLLSDPYGPDGLPNDRPWRRRRNRRPGGSAGPATLVPPSVGSMRPPATDDAVGGGPGPA